MRPDSLQRAKGNLQRIFEIFPYMTHPSNLNLMNQEQLSSACQCCYILKIYFLTWNFFFYEEV